MDAYKTCSQLTVCFLWTMVSHYDSVGGCICVGWDLGTLGPANGHMWIELIKCIQHYCCCNSCFSILLHFSPNLANKLHVVLHWIKCWFHYSYKIGTNFFFSFLFLFFYFYHVCLTWWEVPATLGPCIASGSNTWCHCDSEVSDSGYDIVGDDEIGITCITRNECDDDEYVWIWVNDAPWPTSTFLMTP